MIELSVLSSHESVKQLSLGQVPSRTAQALCEYLAIRILRRSMGLMHPEGYKGIADDQLCYVREAILCLASLNQKRPVNTLVSISNRVRA